MTQVIPVLRVADYDQAVEFYINWLGFKIDWEERPDDGPFQVRISLKEIMLHLIEHHGETTRGAWIILAGFKNLVPYRKIISLKKGPFQMPPIRKVPREPNAISVVVADPFLNRLEFRETMG